jgi:Zn-dependent M28 family amino/carboxypeptidase
MDLKGKVALVLVNDPDFETGKGDFGGKAMTYYGRWTYKFEEAARRRARHRLPGDPRARAGRLRLGDGEELQHQRDLRHHPQADPEREAHAPLEGWIQRDNAVDLFKKAGLDFEALKKQAQTRDFKPVALTASTFSPSYAIDAQQGGLAQRRRRPAGRKHAAERAGDLLGPLGPPRGSGLPDAKGDKIYNGAVDNASGTAAADGAGPGLRQGPASGPHASSSCR